MDSHEILYPSWVVLTTAYNDHSLQIGDALDDFTGAVRDVFQVR